jgi:hypothetical protein
VWTPTNENNGYHLEDGGHIKTATYPFGTVAEFQRGLLFETKALAQKEDEKRIAIKHINDAILEANEGWVADWDNKKQSKYHVGYDHVYGGFLSGECQFTQMQFTIQYAKSKAIMDNIIADYKKDFEKLL